MRSTLLSASAIALLIASGALAQDTTTQKTTVIPATSSETPAMDGADPTAKEAMPSDAVPMEADSDAAEMDAKDGDADEAMGDVPEEVSTEVAGSMDSGTLDRADPEMAQVIEKLMALGAKPVHTLDVPTARTQPTPADAVKAVYLKTTGNQPFPEPVGKTEDIRIDGAAGELDARVYWPEGMADGEDLPVIVYFHGGGWVIANLNVYDASARALSNQANALVVSVHYRQGPEDKFPAAHDDAVAAYSY